ncbi:lipoyl synthase [uncultured Bacteroides sp.]|uniref:lipoyl synthase n=1 Tax=uncultured Bacteroides sp. TaxID=162156 RepID=UPI0026251700|nr:lipoyl synthase [uncultured Bacteroides sp.]
MCKKQGKSTQQPHMERVRKPEWLKISIGANERYAETKRIVDTHCLHTICSSGRCPNLGECWGKGTATFMIGGEICTRSCKFCNTKTGRPLPLDGEEPRRVAESVALMKLSHAVVTSVDRDDLPDLGAAHWAQTIHEIKRLNPDTTIEVLIPDFQGRKELVEQVIEARPDIISHNLETVRRISPLVRSRARYETSLEVIRQIAESGTTAKSGIMVGLGETTAEVEELMDDLRAVGCQILTIGQYLQPSHRHYPVAEYVTPEQFAAYKQTGLAKGFSQVESAPLVRSSYHAEKHVRRNSEF